jgi:hypothetical protein
MCGAMVYMLLAVRAAGPGPGPAMAGPAAAGRFPLLALVFALFMVGYVMWQADRLPAVARAARAAPALEPVTRSGAGPATAPDVAGPDRAAQPGPRALSPGLAACCQIAMGVTMGYMLILML